MHLVEIPLNSFMYRFRRLTWVEEVALRPSEGTDARNVVLAHALHDVSGLSVDSIEDAQRIILAIPRTLRWRIWVIYRGNLPADRYYSTKGMFDAPEPRAYNKTLVDEERAVDQDFVSAQRRFGAADVSDTRDTERRIMDNAMKAHMLRGAQKGQRVNG